MTDQPSTDQPSISDDHVAKLTAGFSDVARSLFSAGSVADTLQVVVELAVATIEGCDLAGIFLLDGDAVTTPVYTDLDVIGIDAAQHQAGEGPCLDAIKEGGSIYAEDLADDARWPRFGSRATALGIRSALAVGMRSNDRRGALNCYARHPRAFGLVDQGKGLLLAGLGDQALAAAEAHEGDERRAGNLEAALVTREVIGQAQGILIEREHLSADQAFDILRRASQHLNVKLRDVAQALVDTGERPDTGAP